MGISCLVLILLASYASATAIKPAPSVNARAAAWEATHAKDCPDGSDGVIITIKDTSGQGRLHSSMEAGGTPAARFAASLRHRWGQRRRLEQNSVMFEYSHTIHGVAAHLEESGA